MEETKGARGRQRDNAGTPCERPRGTSAKLPKAHVRRIEQEGQVSKARSASGAIRRAEKKVARGANQVHVSSGKKAKAIGRLKGHNYSINVS
jgi:hypothetical protein